MPNASERLIRTIRDSVIGDDTSIPGPFGARRIVYADYAASGRALSFIEDYLREQVLPYYANTHSESSGTGRQMTGLREEARELIHGAVGGGAEDCVIFCGSGSTAAIDKVVTALGLRLPAELDERHGLSERIPESERPVVFVGPHEHHSNELPFRESIATLIAIPEGADGALDLTALERELVGHERRKLKIGSFSAGSNVTGALADTLRITELLHRHGALAFWDYAAAGPYVRIEMNPERPGIAPEFLAKDAVFLSPHKFVGGPGSPGVLVAKRKVFANRVPTVPSGGTVTYVNATARHYAPDLTAREEGGTPCIVGAIRAGLVFQLKEAVGSEVIADRERAFVQRAIATWRRDPNLELLGDLDADRLPIVSFRVRDRGRFLHHQFVVRILGDLFGIQARGGCACAGPYGHALLGIDAATGHALEREVLRGNLGIKPGFVRVNFGYFFSEGVFEYVLRAVRIVAERGHRLLSRYRFDPTTGAFSPARSTPLPSRLADIRYDQGRMDHPGQRLTEPESRLSERLDEMASLLEHCGEPTEPAPSPRWSEDFERLRWFTAVA